MSQPYPILTESHSDNDGGYIHTKCGTTLLPARVLHPIHDGPFPLSGSGKVSQEIVPYCPTCETKPAENGRPLKADPGDAEDMAILRRIAHRST